MNIWTASCKDRTAVRDNGLMDHVAAFVPLDRLLIRTAVRDNGLMDHTPLIELARGSTLVCLQVGERRPVFRPQTS